MKMIIECLDNVGTENESDFIEYCVRTRILLKVLRYQSVCAVTGKALNFQRGLEGAELERDPTRITESGVNPIRPKNLDGTNLADLLGRE